MNDRPTAEELLRAVERFLERDVVPRLEGVPKFHARPGDVRSSRFTACYLERGFDVFEADFTIRRNDPQRGEQDSPSQRQRFCHQP